MVNTPSWVGCVAKVPSHRAFALGLSAKRPRHQLAPGAGLLENPLSFASQVRGPAMQIHLSPRPHLREGRDCHTVGSLLERPRCLGGEGPGGRAVVRRRDGQVVLVQKVACAAALALLQAAGTGDSAAGQTVQPTARVLTQMPWAAVGSQ